jgi:hypothetical protein
MHCNPGDLVGETNLMGLADTRRQMRAVAKTMVCIYVHDSDNVNVALFLDHTILLQISDSVHVPFFNTSLDLQSQCELSKLSANDFHKLLVNCPSFMDTVAHACDIHIAKLEAACQSDDAVSASVKVYGPELQSVTLMRVSECACNCLFAGSLCSFGIGSVWTGGQ